MASNDKMAALILAKGKPEESEDEYNPEMALHQCMEDFARALHQTPPDVRGMMHAFRGAFECLAAEPNEEEGEA